MATQLEKQLKELERQKAKGILTDEEYQLRRSALINDTSAPSSSKRGRGIFKWGMMGCLGIFAVLGLLVVGFIVLIAAAVSGSTDKARDSGGDVHVALAAGSSGEISPESNGSKKSKVTILQVSDNAKSTNQFTQPAAGKKYYAIEVLIENVGTKEVSSLDWKMRDSTDAETERDFVSGIGESLEVIYSDLTPGGKKQGWVVFQIAADATPKWIRADPNPFLANDLYFDAQ